MSSDVPIGVLQDHYDPVFDARVDACEVITVSDLGHLKNDMQCAQIRYSNEKEFVAIANTLAIMNDLKVTPSTVL